MIIGGEDIPRTNAFGSVFDGGHGQSQGDNGPVRYILSPLLSGGVCILLREDARVLDQFPTGEEQVLQVLSGFHESIVRNGDSRDDEEGN